MGPQEVLSEIIHIQEAAPGIYHLVARAEALASRAGPGQFVMLRLSGGSDPLLRRPFSLCGVSGSNVEILFKVCGRGTRDMAAWLPGLKVSMIGPLGNGFRVPESTETACLVAGGIGLAPLIFFARRIRQTHERARIKIFMGAGSGAEAGVLDGFDLRKVETCIATEDGSRGYHGLVTDLLKEKLLPETQNGNGRLCLYGCGPAAMAKALAQIAAEMSVPCQLSIESAMACGTGACLGCAVTVTARGNELRSTKRVCVDGPVFDSREIVWKM